MWDLKQGKLYYISHQLGTRKSGNRITRTRANIISHCVKYYLTGVVEFGILYIVANRPFGRAP